MKGAGGSEACGEVIADVEEWQGDGPALLTGDGEQPATGPW